MHNARQMYHCHMTLFRTTLRKYSLEYVGAFALNIILSVTIIPNVSELIFARSLEAAICNTLLWLSSCTTCIVNIWLLAMSFPVIFFIVASSAPLWNYTCFMCNRQGAHKFRSISSSLYCICTGIYYADMTLKYNVLCLLGSNKAILDR